MYFTVEDVAAMSTTQRRDILLSASYAAQRGTSLPASVRELVDWHNRHTNSWGDDPNGFTERAAAVPAEDIHTFVHNHMRAGRFFGKNMRPWTLVPRVIGSRYLRTDRSFRTGIEVELSYPDHAARTAAMAWVTDNVPYASLDPEGEGEGGLEVTFSPMSPRQLFAEDSPLVRYLRYAASAGARGQADGSGGTWGMHVNMSCRSPNRRRDIGLNYGMRTIIPNGIVARAMRLFNPRVSSYETVCKLLHGRRLPYGTDYAHGDYVEYKVCASTVDIEKAKHYVKVISVMYAYQYAHTITDEQCVELLASAMRTSPFADNPVVDSTDWGALADDEDANEEETA